MAVQVTISRGRGAYCVGPTTGHAACLSLDFSCLSAVSFPVLSGLYLALLKMPVKMVVHNVFICSVIYMFIVGQSRLLSLALHISVDAFASSHLRSCCLVNLVTS